MIAAARGDRGSGYSVVKQYGMEATGRRTSVGWWYKERDIV